MNTPLTMNRPFNCIGIVGHPRHPTALATHEMLYHWLTDKGSVSYTHLTLPTSDLV